MNPFIPFLLAAQVVIAPVQAPKKLNPKQLTQQPQVKHQKMPKNNGTQKVYGNSSHR